MLWDGWINGKSTSNFRLFHSKAGCPYIVCTCMCTRTSLNRMKQWLEKRPAFWRVRDLLLLSHTTRRWGTRRASWKFNPKKKNRNKEEPKFSAYLFIFIKCSHSVSSWVALPEGEGDFSVLLFPQQRQRQSFVLVEALMEGLMLHRQLEEEGEKNLASITKKTNVTEWRRETQRERFSPRRSRRSVWAALGCSGGAAAEASRTWRPDPRPRWQAGPTRSAGTAEPAGRPDSHWGATRTQKRHALHLKLPLSVSLRGIRIV